MRTDQLFVYKEQHLDECFDEVCCGITSNTRYKVKDDIGNKVFSILEDSDYCNRNLSTRRSFVMNVINDSNKEIIRLVHPFVCGTCISHELEVQSPPGTVIGHVRHIWGVWQPKFTVENARGEPTFKIAGPCVSCSCFRDDNFELVSLNEAVIDGSLGKICKPFSGCGPNAGADFVLRFPSNLDFKMKATLLGACILIDFMYYDKPKEPVPNYVLCVFTAAITQSMQLL
ncbi:phospholipid scramblase 1-like [Pseudorasbora parva]|uniref:phospholipid scramblase 1-like n=1 Tax=Pseudorasbora parva TaxID=51549 RepID=UPI00351DDBD0